MGLLGFHLYLVDGETLNDFIYIMYYQRLNRESCITCNWIMDSRERWKKPAKKTCKLIFERRENSLHDDFHMGSGPTVENCFFWCLCICTAPLQIITKAPKHEHTERLEMSNVPLFLPPLVFHRCLHFSLPLLCLSSLPFSGDGEGEGVLPAMSRLEKAYPG